MFDKLKMVEKRYNDLNELLSDPKIIAQQSEFQKYAKEQSDLTPIVNRFQDLQKYVKQFARSPQHNFPFGTELLKRGQILDCISDHFGCEQRTSSFANTWKPQYR